MKILFFGSALNDGGAPAIMRLLANGLCDRGYEIGIATDQPISSINRETIFLNDKINLSFQS